jgi:hypothetical protein
MKSQNPLLKSFIFITLLLLFLPLTSAVYELYPLEFPVGDGTLAGADNYVVSQGFNNPFTSGYCNIDFTLSHDSCISLGGRWMYGHDGLDINGRSLPDDEGEPIYAAADGEVVLASWVDGWGNVIQIKHEEDLFSQYAHLLDFEGEDGTTIVGDPVIAGEHIASLGGTGGSWGPHLHFGTLKSDDSVGSGYYFGSDLIHDNHYDPLKFLTGLVDREENTLLSINPFSGHPEDVTGFSKLGYERSDTLTLWTGYVEVHYDDEGIPDDGYIQSYISEEDKGIMLVHPDSGITVEFDGNFLDVWENSDPVLEVENECEEVDDWTASPGYISKLGLPITGSYYLQDEGTWRQDFQKGFMYRYYSHELEEDIIHIDCYSDETPGWGPDGWDSYYSAAIVQAYERNGAAEVVGNAIEPFFTYAELFSDNYALQEFDGAKNEDNAIVVVPSDKFDDNINAASVVRAGFWDHYSGISEEVGPPLGDEIGLDTLDGQLRGYDPLCDYNNDNTVDYVERISCITEVCGDEEDYEVMQRFECVNLCNYHRFFGLDGRIDEIEKECDIGAALSRPAIDEDEDGYSISRGDCNDDDASIHPGALDICEDGIDQDCDGVDSFCHDGGDIDGDGLEDIYEVVYHTDPYNPDSDGDGLLDGEEVDLGMWPDEADGDGDGLDDGDEIRYGTLFYHPDSDFDGLTDGDEVHIYGTDPMMEDTDSDGLHDGDEVEIGTNPTNPDSDYDGIIDGEDTYPLIPAGEIEAKVLGSHGPDVLGTDVEIDGNRIISSAWFHADMVGHLGELGGSGAYIHFWDGLEWVEEAFLTHEDSRFNSFGSSVAIDDDVAVIGAPTNDEAVYVYRFSEEESLWNLEQTISSPDPFLNQGFGIHVEVNGDVITVSSQKDVLGSNLGAVYVYRFDGENWNFEEKIVPDDAAQSFGESVGIGENVIVIGDNSDDTNGVNAGAVWVFRYDGVWVEEQKIIPVEIGTSDAFGISVDINDNVIVVGASGDGSDTGTGEGSVFVYRYNGAEWQKEQKITTDSEWYDYFGYAVSFDGNLLVVGAYGTDDLGSVSGSAYVFRFNGLDWVQEERFLADDGTWGDYFGKVLSVSGNLAVIGSGNKDGVYVYEFSMPDSDDDGLSDGFEINVYDTNPYSSDSDGDGIEDMYDLDTFVLDRDEDGLDYADEVYLYYTHPLDSDTDSDGLLDGEEVNTYFTDPLDIDTDNDHLDDFVEVTVYGTDPLLRDTDGDGLYDDEEVEIGTDPLLVDTDGDGLSDRDEVAIHHTDPLDEDTDGDGMIDSEDLYPLIPPTRRGELSPIDYAGHFGGAVAVDGDLAIVGAKDDGIGGSGKIHPYHFIDGGWFKEDPIQASDWYELDQFGATVVIQGDTAAVGAVRYLGQSKVYMFEREEDIWVETQTLTVPYFFGIGSFGSDIALDGDTLLVGAKYDSEMWRDPEDASRTGAAFIFTRSGGVWTEQVKIRADEHRPEDNFGYAVALEDGIAVVGARGRDEVVESVGAVYVFEGSGASWTEIAKLELPEPHAYATFGSSVAIEGDLIVVGSPRYGSFSTGAAFVYRLVEDEWVYEDTLLDPLGEYYDIFGTKTSIKNGLIYVGSPNGNGAVADTGALFVYKKYEDGWKDISKIIVEDGELTDNFGASMFVSETSFIVGAVNAGFSGEAYIYETWMPQDDEAVTTSGDPIIINVLENDFTDVYADLIVVGVGLVDNGVVVFDDSSITYTPDIDFIGSEDFLYTLRDERDQSTYKALVTITVSEPIIDTDGDGLFDDVELDLGLDPLLEDTDGDGLSDGDEVLVYFTDPLLEDTDGDGLSDGDELDLGLDPLLSDTDGDGLSDGDEVLVYFTDPLLEDSDGDLVIDGLDLCLTTVPISEDDIVDLSGCALSELDSDGDSLSDFDELLIYGTDPLLEDSDSDSLIDFDELLIYGTDPLLEDSDSDGLSDSEEIRIYFTDPLLEDSDSDGLSDYDELLIYGTDPLLEDSDSDGLSDSEEIETYGTNPLFIDTDFDGLTDYNEILLYGTNPLDAYTDGDSLTDGEEILLYHTNPLRKDTDRDKIPDDYEVNILGTDPTLKDTDGDGINDRLEVRRSHTDPLLADTDGDGISDKEELISGRDPLDPLA